MSDWQVYGEGGGGSAVLDRPRAAPGEPREDEVVDDGSGLGSGRTIGAIIRDSVGVGDATITGEVEPNHDAKYQRQSIRLRRDAAGNTVNAVPFSFESATEWPGPLVAFVVFDRDGKGVYRCSMAQPIRIPAGIKMDIAEGQAGFKPIEGGRDG